MLNANGTCTIEKVNGFDVNGEPTFVGLTREACAVIRISRVLEKTTVRADSSSSRGHGDERTSRSKILLQSETVAGLGDRLTVMNLKLRIIDMRERIDVTGYVDHYETDCELWA